MRVKREKGCIWKGSGVERFFSKRWYRLEHPLVNAAGEIQLSETVSGTQETGGRRGAAAPAGRQDLECRGGAHRGAPLSCNKSQVLRGEGG